MDTDSIAPRVLIRRLALAGVFLVLIVTTVSAYMRLTAAGLGCAQWPACYGQALNGGETNALSAPAPAARMLHRITATAAAALILAITLIALTNRRELRRELALSAVLLTLTLCLAILGRATPHAGSPAVAMGNALGGMAMAALLWWLALGPVSRPHTPSPAWMICLSITALTLAVLQVMLGTLTSASFSALACTTLPDCDGRWWPQAWSASQFDPFVAFADRDGPSQAVHLAHRLGGLALTGVTAVLVWTTLRLVAKAGVIALTLAALLALQLVLGGLAVMLSLPLPLVLAHNVTAVLILLTLLALHRILLTSHHTPPRSL
jgi:cytochrome c oxidase assembly protein subunit 15